jgi:hypothetical protein
MAISGQEQIMRAVLAALQASPAFVQNIRRVHRIPVTRANSPAVYLVDGTDKLVKSCSRECAFRIVITVRDDDGPMASDPHKREVMVRLQEMARPKGVIFKQEAITVETEGADADATEVVMNFSACYITRGEWSLDIA